MSAIARVLTTWPYHVHQGINACLSYSVLFWIISPILSTYLIPNLYRNLPRRTQIHWDVRVVSSIQAIFICICSAHVILTDGARKKTDAIDRLLGYSPLAGRVQAFAAGYFVWDFLVSLLHFQVLGLGSLVHATSALLVTMIGFRPFANYYGINFVLYELSTPFLNIHWFMDKSGWTGTKWQLLNGICLITSFFGCRIAWGWYQSVNLYRDIWSTWAVGCPNEDVDVLGDHGLRGNCPTVEGWLALVFLMANTTLSFLNLFWFSLMVRAMRKRFDPPVTAVDQGGKK